MPPTTPSPVGIYNLTHPPSRMRLSVGFVLMQLQSWSFSWTSFVKLLCVLEHLLVWSIFAHFVQECLFLHQLNKIVA